MVMARTRRVKSMAEGTAHYHLISRASNRQFLFRKVRTKDKLVELVRKAAEFSGIELEACAIMDNHIHVLCTVVRTGDKVPEAEIVRRVREVFSGCLPNEPSGCLPNAPSGDRACCV